MRSCAPVLLVEDDTVDTVVVQRAFKELKIVNELVCKVHGQDALEYLRNAENTRPCIILLDLNMPIMDGFELLEIIKADDELKKIPVVILTTSTEQRDLVKGFHMNIAGYFIKPADYAKSLEQIEALDMYWTLTRLPNGEIQVLPDRVVANTSSS